MSSESPDLSTLDREALARTVGQLEAQLTTARIRTAEAEAAHTETLNERDKLLAAITDHHSQKADDRCFLDDDELYATAGLPVVDRRVGDKLAMLENCRRFIERRCEGGGWPTYAELETEIDRHRRSAELQEQARTADACTECKGTGEIGYISQTELGPEGDSSECDACFGSGSQRMANKIGEFFASEYAVFVEMSELLATKAEIPRDEFESESAHITRAIEKLVDKAAKDYADMRRFQSDVIRLTHENNNLESQLAASRAEVKRLVNAYGYSEQEAERQEVAFHQSLRAQVDAKSEVERLRERERHFAQVLGVADGGRYRADWDGHLEAVIAERDKYQIAARVLCGGHIGVSQNECPVCERDRLRAALAQVSGATKKRVLTLIREHEQDIRDKRKEGDMKRAALFALQQVEESVTALDIAAIVAASADILTPEMIAWLDEHRDDAIADGAETFGKKFGVKGTAAGELIVRWLELRKGAAEGQESADDN